MKNTVLSAIIALIAACKPKQKLAGTYAHITNTPNYQQRDEIYISKDPYSTNRYEIGERMVKDYPPGGRDSTFASKAMYTGILDSASNKIITKDTTVKMKYLPRKNAIKLKGKKYRRI